MRICGGCETENSDALERCRECGALLDEPGSDPLETKILALLQENRKIEAIKVYREKTGTGLREAKEAVEGLAAGRPLPPPPAKAPEKGMSDIVGLIRAGRKIEAIKLHREQTGKGLKEAKDDVERMAREEGIELPKSGCLVILAGLFAFYA